MLFKVPYKILPHVIKDTKFLRAYCVYGKLKIICGKKGLFFNYKHRKQELCNLLGISYNTLCSYVRILKTNNLVWESYNNLRLAESYAIYKAFNIEININNTLNSKRNGKICTKQFRLKYEDINEDTLTILACKLKQEQITYMQLKNVENILLEKYGNIQSDNTLKKVEKLARKKAKTIYSHLSTNNSYNFLTIEKEYGFLDNNMSLQSYATFFGKKSKFAAMKRLNRYKEKGLCSIEKRSVKFAEAKNFNLKEAMNTYGKGWRIWNNSFYCIVPSKITFK